MRIISMAFVLVGISLVSPQTARAQASPIEVAGGYSFLHDQDLSENFPGGWMASVAASVAGWLSAVGEVSGNYKTLDIPGDRPKLSTHTFMGGPRFRVRTAHLAPFAQVLFGAARDRVSVLGVGDTETDFAYQPGVGVDLHFIPRIGVRLEGDYRITRSQGSNSKESRVIVAAVFGFGS